MTSETGVARVRVTVHLHTTLQRQTPQGLQRQLEVELPVGSLLSDLLEHLAVAVPEDTLLLAVNYRVADVDYRLQDGDRVNIMPAISGG